MYASGSRDETDAYGPALSEYGTGYGSGSERRRGVSGSRNVSVTKGHVPASETTESTTGSRRSLGGLPQLPMPLLLMANRSLRCQWIRI